MDALAVSFSPSEPVLCPTHHGHSHSPVPQPSLFRHSRWMTMPSRRAMRKRRMALIRATQSQVNLQSARYRQPAWPQSC